jgi:hypothetical protein
MRQLADMTRVMSQVASVDVPSGDSVALLVRHRNPYCAGALTAPHAGNAVVVPAKTAGIGAVGTSAATD